MVCLQQIKRSKIKNFSNLEMYNICVNYTELCVICYMYIILVIRFATSTMTKLESKLNGNKLWLAVKHFTSFQPKHHSTFRSFRNGLVLLQFQMFSYA